QIISVISFLGESHIHVLTQTYGSTTVVCIKQLDIFFRAKKPPGVRAQKFPGEKVSCPWRPRKCGCRAWHSDGRLYVSAAGGGHRGELGRAPLSFQKQSFRL